MNTYPVHINGEVAARTTMKLFQYVNIGGAGSYQPFEKPILWMICSETQLSYWHGNELLKEECVFTDYYGYLESINFDSLHKRLAKKYSVDQKSSLEMRLTTNFLLTPYIEDDDCFQWNEVAKENGKRYKARVIPDTFCYETKPRHESDPKHYQRLTDIPLDREVVWSSYLDDDQNDSRLRIIKGRWELSKNNLSRIVNSIQRQVDILCVV